MVNPLDALEVELGSALAGLSAEETQMTPPGTSGKWSIQQIVEHLFLSYEATLAVIRKRLEKGRPTETPVSLPQRIGQFTLVRLGYFPRGRDAPSAVCPGDGLTAQDGGELGARAQELLDEMKVESERAESMFGDRRSASHMILGPLSMKQWRKFHLVHGRHHIKQIRAIREARGLRAG